MTMRVKSSGRKLVSWAAIAFCFVPLSSGCGSGLGESQAGPPPLNVSFRKSQIPGRGLVAGLNNPSSTSSVEVLTVFVQKPKETDWRSYRLDRKIRPQDSISVGWVELDGWKLSKGDRLRIRCRGYSDDFECDVAATPTTSNATSRKIRSDNRPLHRIAIIPSSGDVQSLL
jgi:hypothetical protein